jgi:hypothetical protein
MNRDSDSDLAELQSRRSSITNLNDLVEESDSLTQDGRVGLLGSSSSSIGGERLVIAAPIPPKTLKWSTLRKATALIYPTGEESERGMIGLPTVLAVNGIIVIGTDRGWVGIFDFAQNLISICGTEAIGKSWSLFFPFLYYNLTIGDMRELTQRRTAFTANESGAVTALAISQDHTFVAIGHTTGFIHLYSLASSSPPPLTLRPTRSVPPTTLALIISGRKEGHLIHSKILRIGFVGARHTALVSSDDKGLAFFHTLGRVLLLASTDIIRMLGKYPDSVTAPPPPSSAFNTAEVSDVTKRKLKKSIILDMISLPLGPSLHPSDSHSLVSLLTPSKLVIVGLKPNPRTWWRATPTSSSPNTSSGVMAWYPSITRSFSTSGVDGEAEGEEGSDPLLAFSWNSRIRFVRVIEERSSSRASNEKSDAEVEEVKRKSSTIDIEFVEIESEGWECEETILALQWYNERVCIIFIVLFSVHGVTQQVADGSNGK